MCGIAGIVSTEPVGDLAARSRRMQAALRHRGPDDEGIFLAENSRVSLVHTRLAILDLTSAGHQPMVTDDHRLAIIFNGEIYNFRELRAELEHEGVEFRSHSDTEVILRLYERRGTACVKQLRGMFAFAIWDNSKQKCVIARDPLGIKPLYYTVSQGHSQSQIVFASEIRSLAVGLPKKPTLSRAGLIGFLRYGSVPEPLTMLSGIECLPAGTVVTWQSGVISSETYWTFPGAESVQDQSIAGDCEASLSVRNAILDSVRAHHVSDVPVSVFLSGGIDSTAIAALSRIVTPKPMSTFSITFDDCEFAEGKIARRTAAWLGTDHHEWVLSGGDAYEQLDGYFRSLDQPTVDGFNTWCVAKWAARHGAKVVLSGLGGDELFGGYPTFKQVPILAAVGQLPKTIRRLASISLGAPWLGFRPARFAEFMNGNGTVVEAWECARGLFRRNDAVRIADWLLAGEGDGSDLNEITDAPAVCSTREAVSWLETVRYMRNQLLRDGDAMTMSWGLELRTPLVDSRLTSAVWSLPPEVRFRTGKRLLADAIPELPGWVLDQPKRGFQFPMQRWLDREWASRFAPLVDEAPIGLERWYQLWMVAVFMAWRTHVLGAESPMSC